MKQLISSFIFCLALFFTNNADAKILSLEENLEAVCRVNVQTARGLVRGTGTVVAEYRGNYYILTNGHVATGANSVTVEFFQNGFKSSRLPCKVVWINYRVNTSVDAAILEIPKASFNGYNPRVIPLAPRGYQLSNSQRLKGGGCPSGRWAMGWIGRTTKATNTVTEFNAAPEGGQSGTGVLVDIDGNSRVGMLLTWRVSDEIGAGISIELLYRIFDGEVSRKGMGIPKWYQAVGKNTIVPNVKHCNCGISVHEHTQPYVINGVIQRRNGKPLMLCPMCTTHGLHYHQHINRGIKVEERCFPFRRHKEKKPNAPLPFLRPPGDGNPDPRNSNPWPNRPPKNDPDIPKNPNEIEEYKARIEELENKLDNQKDELKRLDELYGGLSNSLKESGDLNKTLNQKIIEINSSNKTLQIQINNVNHQYKTIIQEKNRAIKERDDVTNQLGNSEETIADLEADLEHPLDGYTGGNGANVERGGWFSIGFIFFIILGILRFFKRFNKNNEDKSIGKYETLNPNASRPEYYTEQVGKDIQIVKRSPQEEEYKYEHVRKRIRYKKRRGSKKKDISYSISDERVYNKVEKEKDVDIETLIDVERKEDGTPIKTRFKPLVQQNQEITIQVDSKESKNDIYGEENFIENLRNLPKGTKQELVGATQATRYEDAPRAMTGLPPSLPNTPFGSRKTVNAEQILTALGQLVNEYGDDRTMSTTQIWELLRHRLKTNHNVEIS